MENTKEKVIKVMLETWVARDGNLKIDSYNFIREDCGHYTVSVIEKDNNENVFLSVYWVEMNDTGIRIVEME